VYDGLGEVGGRLQRIRSFVADDGQRRVEHEDGETFRIGADGLRIERVVASPGEPVETATIERALGGALALALATRGIFLLHASAVRSASGVIALTAESGAGKSTLAAAAMAHADLGLVRVADDQLPVSLSSTPRALPHFPQLKLRAGEAYGPAEAPVLPLRMLVEVSRVPGLAEGRNGTGAHLHRLSDAEACLALTRATVAARLFDPDLLASHFEACAAASKWLQVYRLHYTAGLDRLREPLVRLAERAAPPHSRHSRGPT